MRIALWNTEWAKPHTPRGQIIRGLILGADPDVICLTEAVPAILPDDGHRVVPSDEPAYERKDGGHKVMLWSREPWSATGTELTTEAPARFVEGVQTHDDFGAIRFTGVCIPWSASRVSTGDGTRKRWQDHIAFIEALGQRHAASPGIDGVGHRIVLGDFNQRIPPFRIAKRAASALAGYLDEEDLTVITEGIGERWSMLIDHVAVSPGLNGEVLKIWPKEVEGTRLSDHVGILVGIEPTPSNG